MSKRRVLIFTNSFRIGGSEGQALQLIKHLDRSRFDVHVACFDYEGPLLDQLPSDVGMVSAFPLRGFANAHAVRQAAAFVALLRKTRIQILQTFDLYTNVFGLPLARVAGVPITVGSRRDHGLKRTIWQMRAERWSLRLARRVVANAEAIKNRLVEDGTLASGRIAVIKNGLDLTRFPLSPSGFRTSEGRDARSVVFAVVGNLRPEKGHLLFVQAAQKVAAVCPEAQFVLIGEGAMRQKIEESIQELGLRDKVHLLGASKNVPQSLQNVDVLVSPSDTEGLPNSVLEGMAASKPVVATDAGGTRELVEEGVTGYLVPVGDSDMLASRMIALCQSPTIRATMGGNARRQVERSYATEHIANQFARLYDELTSCSPYGQSCDAGRAA